MAALRLFTIVALFVLLLTGALAYTSAWNDAAIVDEDPHIGAGISYLTQRDMRINPEHPPLVKDLAALPLLLIPDLVVPTDHKSWTDDINGQWDFGRAFLFESGNDADLILRLARIAPILIMLLLGWFLFSWTRGHAGVLAAFLALLFYVSNPVVLAHGRFVTTDVPAAAGMFLATIFFLRFLANPSRKNLILAGTIFGLAQLTKFSAALLVPYFGILALSWWTLEGITKKTPWRRGLFRTVGGTIGIGLIGLGIIYLVYIFHVAQYPYARQVSDTASILTSFPNQTVARAINAIAAIPIFRPLAQYLLGLAMVAQRATGGNTTFFLGEVSASGWIRYFPTVWLVKVPLAFHIFTLLAFLVGLRSAFRAARQCLKDHRKQYKTLLRNVAAWKYAHFSELAMLFFIALYWYTSLTSNLNIGVRHLLPTIPFVAALAAIGTRVFLRAPAVTLVRSWGGNVLALFSATFRMGFRSFFVTVLLLWFIFSGIAAWPFYLTSFNELASLRGGGANWAVDSNLDWGQDLKRFASFVKQKNIDRIAVDYFGWTPPSYYIRDAEVIPWSQDNGVPPSGWFAVSATYLKQACARPAPGFQQNTTGYCPLSDIIPNAVIGGSIYVYRLP